MSGQDEIEQVWREVDALPQSSPVAISLLERGIRVADAAGDVQAGWDLREELMNRVWWTGDWKALLVHFGWCIAQHDRDPSAFPAEDFLWQYKWVVNEAARMPHVGRDRLIGLLEDMERRFRVAGSSMRAVEQHRALTLAKLGRLEEVRPAIERWWGLPRDWLSDCAACEPDTRAELLAQIGDPDAACDVALGTLRARASCGEIPHRTYGRTLAALRRRDPDRADAHHRQGYALCRGEPKLVEAHAQHLAHAAARGWLDDAARILDRHLPGALAHPTAWERMLFLTATHRACDALLADGRARVPVRLPESVPLAGDGQPLTGELSAWARDGASALAAAFDARNGNDAVSAWVGRWRG